MITVPTVFVLGAGASHPYGLPLGYQLRLNILDRYNVDEGHATYLLNMTPFRRHSTTPPNVLADPRISPQCAPDNARGLAHHFVA